MFETFLNVETESHALAIPCGFLVRLCPMNMVVDADILTNPTLAETFRANWDMQDTDLTFRSVEEDKAIATAGGGSSDMGNICHIMPGDASSHDAILSEPQDCIIIACIITVELILYALRYNVCDAR